MPQSVEEVTFAAVALAVLLALCTFAIRRWGVEAEPEPLLVLWRKWAALGKHEQVPQRKKRPVPRKAPPARPVRQKKPVEAEPVVTRTRPHPVKALRTKMAGAPREDMPLTDDEPALEESAEPKLAFRHRFRRGLRKTRDVLNRDVREVFGKGPIPESFDALEEALVAADVGVFTATAVTDELRERREELSSENLPKALRDAMVARLASSDRRLRLSREKLSVWIVVGVNGTGKTTSIAKLAARAKALGLKVCLAAGDTFRAAAAEQLEEWGKRLEVDVVRQKAGADPGAVVFDALARARARGDNLVICDTAGRLHTRKPLMDELEKVVRVIERDENAALTECLLVIDATTGQNGISQAKAFKDAVGVTGLVLAKLDGTAKGGIAFAVERELDVPVKAVGVGEHHKDLVPFEPETFVDALLGLGQEDE